MDKIMATVSFGINQFTQAWDFIPRDNNRDEDAILILKSSDNGGLYGIPLVESYIQKLKDGGVAEFNYLAPISGSDAKFIPRAGNPN